MSVTTYTAHSCPKLSISQVSSMSSAPSSPIGVEATITISTKKPNTMSSGSVDSTESSDPLESDYSEDDGQDVAKDSSSEVDEEEDESSQRNNLSESDDESEQENGDDTDDDSNIDDAVKGGRKYSLDDFQILKTVGKISFQLPRYTFIFVKNVVKELGQLILVYTFLFSYFPSFLGEV